MFNQAGAEYRPCLRRNDMLVIPFLPNICKLPTGARAKRANYRFRYADSVSFSATPCATGAGQHEM